MGVIGGIALFTFGIATGGGVVVFTQRVVKNQTAQLRRENEHLKESAWRDRLEYDKHRAYARGYKDGRLSPANDAERFAEFIEDRNIDFRGQRRRQKVYGAEGAEEADQ